MVEREKEGKKRKERSEETRDAREENNKEKDTDGKKVMVMCC